MRQEDAESLITGPPDGACRVRARRPGSGTRRRRGRSPGGQEKGGAMRSDSGLPTDEELMSRIAARDSAAFALLVERFLDRGTAFARRVLVGGEGADDVMQDAFMRVWRHAPKWRADGRARFSTWFYRVVLNLCLDRKRRPAAVSLDETAEPADRAAPADERLHQNDVGRAVRRAMDALPARQRAALALCYFDGLSNREAAEILGVRVKALESLLSRGRAALRERLTASRDDLLGDEE